MKRLTTIALAIAAFCNVACAKSSHSTNTEENSTMNKTLVVYFSATGTTKAVATRLAKVTGASLHEIRPATPYTAADLDWEDKQSRSSVEMENPSARPAIADTISNWADYDTIFIGFPIWWYTAPRIVNTFLDKYDPKGKTLIPFCTSGSSTVDKAAADLKAAYPTAKWQPGRTLNGASDKYLLDWISALRRR